LVGGRESNRGDVCEVVRRSQIVVEYAVHEMSSPGYCCV
jgi:DNA-directed RNA polymerase subunit H (RpoH/RPB5)